MTHRSKVSSASRWLFLAGLGSMTEVHFFGSIALTELAMFVVGPILFFVNYRRLRREGFLPFVWLTILTCVGCVVSGKVNGTYWLFTLKGLAVPTVLFTATIVFHRLLSVDLSAMKWFVIGAFASSIVSIFIFQQETYTASSGGEIVVGKAAIEAVMGYALFWTHRINAILTLPIKCFYLHMPVVYSCMIPVVCACVSVLFSDTSGRAGAAVAMSSMSLLLVGGKTKKKIARLGKHIWLLLIFGCILAFSVKTVYSYCAKRGLLGEDAKSKYEKQTATGTGILNILMAGRMELFCGLQACIDFPIIGLGSRPEDRYGYTENYLFKYASQNDFDTYLRTIENLKKRGDYYYGIPDHSHLVYFWLRYGIFGLLLWLYVFWIMFKYIKNYAPAIPQWYGYMCLMIPSMAWNILFNPPGSRLETAFFVVCLLLCKAISEGRKRLPFEMEMETRSAG